MKEQKFDELKGWFAKYVQSFYTACETDNRNIHLKEDHSFRVMGNMGKLAASIGLGGERTITALAIGLFHDLGRFTQYQKYKTFHDPISINHAAEAVRVLRKYHLLDDLPDDERRLMIRTIGLHNVFMLPKRNSDDELLFLNMIRDADKLDIWRVFIHCYGLPESERPTAAGLGCRESDEYSPQVLDRLRSRKNIRYTMLDTLNDFRLLKLSWVYDMNFPESLRIAASEGYVDGIAGLLPSDPGITAAVSEVREYLRGRAV